MEVWRGCCGNSGCSPRRSPWSWNLRWNCLPSRNRSKDFSLDESRTSRYAGALMLFASLARLDLWSVLQAFDRSVAFVWINADGGATVFCFALRFRSIEDSKNIQRKLLWCIAGDETGAYGSNASAEVVAVVGKPGADVPEPRTPSALCFVGACMKGMYYVDGHFCPYGQHATPRGWHPQRRLAAPGHTDVYVHDVRGRVRPLNDSLARAMPQLVAEIRQVHGERPFTVVFDRGGYSGKLFPLAEREKHWVHHLSEAQGQATLFGRPIQKELVQVRETSSRLSSLREKDASERGGTPAHGGVLSR